MPKAFDKWVKKNKDNIILSRKKDKEPYFLKYNKGIVDRILNPKELSAIEKSKLQSKNNNAGTTKSNKIKYAKKQNGWFGTDGADNVMPIFTKENTSFEYKNGGKVTTHESRIKNYYCPLKV